MKTAQVVAFAFAGWCVVFVLALRVVAALGAP